VANHFGVHDQVICQVPIPRLRLDAGAKGVVVRVHGEGLAFEIEFLSEDGSPLGVEAVCATDLEFQVIPLQTNEEYKKELVKARRLMDLSPSPDSPDFLQLETLLARIGAYEALPTRPS
jgi:hypothetical protein